MLWTFYGHPHSKKTSPGRKFLPLTLRMDVGIHSPQPGNAINHLHLFVPAGDASGARSTCVAVNESFPVSRDWHQGRCVDDALAAESLDFNKTS